MDLICEKDSIDMRFRKIRKSSFVRNTEIAVAIIALLITAGLFLRRLVPTSTVPYNFLEGRQAGMVEGELGTMNMRYSRCVYSFKADFNDVCAAADAELMVLLGYGRKTPTQQEPRRREYVLNNSSGGESITVTILDKHQLKIYSTLENFDCSSQDIFAYNYKDGYVVVDISQRGKQSMGWRAYLRYWLMRLLP